MSAQDNILMSQSWRKTAPSLSVLIPFYHDDPLPALRALERQILPRAEVEILIHDDGTNNPDLNAKIAEFIAQTDLPLRAKLGSPNVGRSGARNALEADARAAWLLFLDADMEPVSAGFLQNYLGEIARDTADVIFGGFEVSAKQADPARELHRALSAQSDCLPLSERQAAGPQFVASSNLCVRKDVLRKEPFDADFKGWGWEDSEWAARIANDYRLSHIDNPALHLGLETTETLLTRFQTSGPNYARFTRKHPELAQSLALYSISKKIGKLPGQRAARPLLKLIVKGHILPLRLRLLALKIWRASWYAEALS